MYNYQRILRRSQLHVLALARKVAVRKGQRVYLVGGTVRDLLLNRPEVDLDLAVEGDGLLFARELATRLGGRVALHESFLTATIYWGGERIDIATTRQEYYPFPGARPEIKPAPLGDDLARRDFSINAMALPLAARDLEAVIDPFNGRKDLSQKILRVLHRESFNDDPARLFRGARFAGRMKLEWDSETRLLAREALAAGCLEKLDPGRYWTEFFLILKEKNPPAAWENLIALGWQGLPETGVPDVEAARRAGKLLYQWKWRGRRPVDAGMVYFLIATAKMDIATLERVLECLKFGRKKRRLIAAARELLAELAPCLSRGSLPACLPASLHMAPEMLLFIFALTGWSRLPGRLFP